MLNKNVWGAKCIPTFAVLFLACLWINSHCLLNSHYLLNSHSLKINSHYILNSHCLINSDKKKAANVGTRGGVEDIRLEAKAKDTKKIRGQGQGQPFRGQTFSRPRTGMLEAKAKDQGHSKKKGLQKSFSGNLQFIGVARIFDWRGLNHKSHAMTSSKTCLLALNQDFAKGKGLN